MLIIRDILEKVHKIINIISKMITFAEFFAGVGGFRLGLESLGFFKCLFANDFDSHCEKIYNLNFKEPKLTCSDIHALKPQDIPDVDLFVGGFPCQPYSQAGKKKGFQDERSTCLFKFMELIAEKKPKFILMENVKNLVTHNNGESMKTIVNKLRDIGYTVKYEVLDTNKITKIPQHRERVFIFGSRDPQCVEKFRFPQPICDSEKIKIRDLLDVEGNVPDRYYYTDKSTIYQHLKRDVINMDTLYQYRRTYVRENKSQVCPTLTANMGTGGNNIPIFLESENKIRKLTPRECFRLQGFPESYLLDNLADSHLYKQSGNAVSVPVIELLGKEILNVIS